ncbi:hypothetical protein HELRODRAFT_165205 [Helobdella robusta]|uniref:Endonuclease/exonuclease/phosphatase domain-containing protein n=1 Tax=Helobdella robusta TaxID=6412 RepID=T1EWF5_HELRO|nr:hypothetical protein HELRODRAFT_165205 [Helobdella robusta]ESN93048.1 hypothetical protein HELRODRAFT_165205 [Helobdella robusta]
MTVTFASIVKRNVDGINNEVKVVQKTLAEVNETKEKETNLIIFRLKEGENDRANVETIFKNLTDDVTEKNILKITRLGKKDENKIRPLLVKLENIGIKNLIMKNVYKIKSLAEEYAGIGLSDDLTKEQRQEYKMLRTGWKMENSVVSNENETKYTSSISTEEVMSRNDVMSDCNVLLGMLNIRSINSNSDKVYEMIQDGLDILVLVETWHGSTENIDLPPFDTFEVVALKFVINSKGFVLLSLYRPGSVQVNALFFEELSKVLDNITLLSSSILLLDLFETFNLTNLISEPIHEQSGTLDLVVCSENFHVSVSNIFPSGVYSDHSLIHLIAATGHRPAPGVSCFIIIGKFTTF